MIAEIIIQFSSPTKSSIILLCRGSTRGEPGLPPHRQGS